MSPLGLGHAVWCAREIIGEEPFAVMLPDMLMDAQPPALAQLVAAYEKVGGNVVAVEPAPQGQTHRYGIVDLGPAEPGFGERLSVMTGMVEKPPPGSEPSDLFISGRYILQPELFDILTQTGAGAGGEIQLTDAMRTLMGRQPFHALRYDGVTYDCGDPIGLLRANVAYALKHPELGPAASETIRQVLEG
jgi:UTP--glucose-1-phosphate uridylyltransferase